MKSLGILARDFRPSRAFKRLAMTLKELCEKMDTTLHEYQVPSASPTTTWACEVGDASVSERGFVMNMIGLGKTKEIARKRLAENLRGTTIFINKEPACGHSSPCSHMLSMTVPTDLTA